MKEYRYKLENGSKKHLCPECGQRRFVRYIDTVSRQYLQEKYGRCDRESNCAYHLSPYVDGYGKLNDIERTPHDRTKSAQATRYCIPEAILNQTLSNYENNIFIQNLLKLVPVNDVKKAIELYRIGTASNGARIGAVTFPFIDYSGNIRTIQAKQFNDTNHTISTDFVHSMVARDLSKNGEELPGWLQDYTKNEKFVSCLFGEHLLKKYPFNPVALVEAPKTAIIGSLYYGFPETPGGLLWLAVYNKSSLTPEKCEVLKGRKVVLYPDLNAYSEWSKKVEIISRGLPGTRFIVSDLLEKNATPADKTAGFDLADYLTRFDYKLFKRSEPVQVCNSEPVPELQTLPASEVISENGENCASEIKQFVTPEEIIPLKEKAHILRDILKIDNFFASCELPSNSFQLNSYTTITDTTKFVQGHLSMMKTYRDKSISAPYFNRLLELKAYLDN